MTQTIFRAAHLVDPHFPPLNKIPQARAESFHEDVRQEWMDFAVQCKLKQMDAVFISGDLFHLKRQSYYAPEDVLYVSSLVNALPCELVAIPGNHDLPHSSYEQVGKTAYKLLNESTDNMHCLALNGERAFRNEYSIPFDLNKQGLQTGKQEVVVRVYGLPYLPLADLRVELPKLNERILQNLREDHECGHISFSIVLLHPDAMPQDDLPLHFEVISYKDLLGLVPAANVLCLGHIHHSYPVFTQQSPMGHTQFISKPFSFARVVKDYFATTHILEHQHKPMYADLHLFLDDSNQLQFRIEYCEIKCRPFNEIFLMDSLNREMEAGKKISSFIQQLRSNYGSVAAAFTVQQPEDLLTAEKVPAEIRQIIHSYLERGETSK